MQVKLWSDDLDYILPTFPPHYPRTFPTLLIPYYLLTPAPPPFPTCHATTLAPLPPAELLTNPPPNLPYLAPHYPHSFATLPTQHYTPSPSSTTFPTSATPHNLALPLSPFMAFKSKSRLLFFRATNIRHTKPRCSSYKK